LLHEPKVLLLDEPATGLDPIARIDLRQQLKSLNAEGLTILISSHILADLEDICTHVAFIENGANAAGADGQSTIELHPQTDVQQEYEIAWLGDADIKTFAAQHPQVSLIATEGSMARLRIAVGAPSAAATLKALIASGFQITRFAESNDGLENRYQKVFGGRS
jgi:ABC-2 type transport system ATP-binding protein